MTDAVRRKVAERARDHCEYCLILDGDRYFVHEVDHIISRKHGGASTLENLALACNRCNLHKGSDVGTVVGWPSRFERLYNPRLDRWPEHFDLRGVLIEPLTTIGAGTARLLRLNHAERVQERLLLQALGRYPRQWP